MNPKISKLAADIEKTKARISELQARLRDMEQQKTDLENTDIIAVVRSLNMTPSEVVEFIKTQKTTPGSSPEGLRNTDREQGDLNHEN